MSAHISASIGKVLRDDLVKAYNAFHSRLYTLWYRHHTHADQRDVEKIQSVLGEGLNMILLCLS